MTLSTSGYTVGANRPLNHARILWQPISGTVTGGGTTPELAANDYTNQRWIAPAGRATWLLTASAAALFDTVFIAAHNLGGKTIRLQMDGATRTNLLLRSEEFDNATWTKSQTTVTANSSAAPNGAASAEKLVPTAVAADHITSQTFAGITTGQQYTYSVFVKADGYGWARVSLGTSFGANWAFVNLSTGAIGLNSGQTNITAVSFGNGWWRLSGTVLATATGNGTIQIYAVNANSFTTFVGDTTSGILAWGAQVELGTAATSYIPTTTAAVASGLVQIGNWTLIDDNSTIAIMTNNAGAPWSTTRLQIEIGDGTGVQIGIIRAGVALQMERPVFGGIRPIGLSRAVESRHSQSETGQWLGRTIQRQASLTEMPWDHLTSAWYRANFAPFALALPQTPFGLIQNPLRMPESVAWCWTDAVPVPENMGIVDLMSVSLPITGFLE